MTFFNHTNVSFKRIEDGTIRPVCKCDIKKGTIVFYELPVKSNGDFQLDIIRYTMKCIYSGQVLFPCIFNKDDSDVDDRFKVFFDYVFKTKFRRNVSEKLAISLLEQCKPPYIFTAIGIFEISDSFNCQRVSLQPGDTFMIATKDLHEGDVLISSYPMGVPCLEDNEQKVMEYLGKLDFSKLDDFNFAMSHRENAKKRRPNGKIECVVSSIDGGLESRLEQYRLDNRMGITSFKESYIEMSKNMSSKKEDVHVLEKMYLDLSESFEN